MIELDVRYFEPVRRLLTEYRPAIIFHLAAQSLPTLSWERPWETIDTNVLGTINLFEAVKAAKLGNAAYDPVIVVACSSAQYGASMTPENVPIDEAAPMLPLHPYGVSKVAQDFWPFNTGGATGCAASVPAFSTQPGHASAMMSYPTSPGESCAFGIEAVRCASATSRPVARSSMCATRSPR